MSQRESSHQNLPVLASLSLISGLLNYGKINFSCLHHPVYSILLWQLELTNTGILNSYFLAFTSILTFSTISAANLTQWIIYIFIYILHFLSLEDPPGSYIHIFNFFFVLCFPLKSWIFKIFLMWFTILLLCMFSDCFVRSKTLHMPCFWVFIFCWFSLKRIDVCSGRQLSYIVRL